jgi:hypothetical protein
MTAFNLGLVNSENGQKIRFCLYLVGRVGRRQGEVLENTNNGKKQLII